ARSQARYRQHRANILWRTLSGRAHEARNRTYRSQRAREIFVATRFEMGIDHDEGERRTAITSRRFACRIHHRTLLGLHPFAGWLSRIPGRNSTLEVLDS